MQRSPIARLSVMMFLEFFIWGAWLPLSFSYWADGGLGFSSWQQSLLNTAFPISAILAMFFSNQFVDRNFAAERFLAFSQFIGGLAMLGLGILSWMAFRGAETVQPNFWLFFACMALHCLFYVPTFSVTNAIAFAHIKDAQKEFGLVRLWGTIGWIAASWPFIFILVDWTKVPPLAKVGFVEWLGSALRTGLSDMPLNQGKSWAFLTAGIASLVLAVFSLFLPHTPAKPANSAENEFAWLEAMSYLKRPFLFVLFIVTWIDATVHDGFFFFAFRYLESVKVPVNWVMPALTVGQFAEIATMAILGYVLKSFGWRFTMIIGVLGHGVRFAVWAFFPDPYLAVAVNLVHGICYAFFFASLYILVDEYLPKDARTSAQGLFNFLIFGAGPLTGRYLWQALKDRSTTDGVVNYRELLMYPAGASLLAGLLLLLFFHPPKHGTPDPQSLPAE